MTPTPHGRKATTGLNEITNDRDKSSMSGGIVQGAVQGAGSKSEKKGVNKLKEKVDRARKSQASHVNPPAAAAGNQSQATPLQKGSNDPSTL